MEERNIAEIIDTLEKMDPQENVIPKRFGDSFFLLFECLHHSRKLPKDNPIRHRYLSQAETHGNSWQHFLLNNRALLEEIKKALIEEQIYADLLKAYRNLNFHVHFDPNRLNDIGIPIRLRLNKLLERAADAMRKVGINYEEFQ